MFFAGASESNFVNIAFGILWSPPALKHLNFEKTLDRVSPPGVAPQRPGLEGNDVLIDVAHVPRRPCTICLFSVAAVGRGSRSSSWHPAADANWPSWMCGFVCLRLLLVCHSLSSCCSKQVRTPNMDTYLWRACDSNTLLGGLQCDLDAQTCSRRFTVSKIFLRCHEGNLLPRAINKTCALV